MVHRCSLRQLFANAAIAASRVGASIAVNVPLWTGATFQGGAVAYAHSRRLSAGASDDAFMIAAVRSVHDSHPPIVVSKVSAPTGSEYHSFCGGVVAAWRGSPIASRGGSEIREHHSKRPL